MISCEVWKEAEAYTLGLRECGFRSQGCHYKDSHKSVCFVLIVILSSVQQVLSACSVLAASPSATYCSGSAAMYEIIKEPSPHGDDFPVLGEKHL